MDVIGDLPFTPIDWPDPGSAWPSDDPQPYTPPEPNPAPSPGSLHCLHTPEACERMAQSTIDAATAWFDVYVLGNLPKWAKWIRKTLGW